MKKICIILGSEKECNTSLCLKTDIGYVTVFISDEAIEGNNVSIKSVKKKLLEVISTAEKSCKTLGLDFSEIIKKSEKVEISEDLGMGIRQQIVKRENKDSIRKENLKIQQKENLKKQEENKAKKDQIPSQNKKADKNREKKKFTNNNTGASFSIPEDIQIDFNSTKKFENKKRSDEKSVKEPGNPYGDHQGGTGHPETPIVPPQNMNSILNSMN